MKLCCSDNHYITAPQSCNRDKVETKEEEDVKSSLGSLKLRDVNRLIFGQVHINSIRNKFELLFSLISNNVDVLLICATKIDKTFPVSQFCVPGYSAPFRLGRTGNGGGIMLYVKHIPCRMVSKFTFEKEIEGFAIEINLCKVYPQGSILGPLLFNINTLDTFFEQKDVNLLDMQIIIHHIFVIRTLE